MTYGSESECATHYTTAPLLRRDLTAVAVVDLGMNERVMRVMVWAVKWSRVFLIRWRSRMDRKHDLYTDEISPENMRDVSKITQRLRAELVDVLTLMWPLPKPRTLDQRTHNDGRHTVTWAIGNMLLRMHCTNSVSSSTSLSPRTSSSSSSSSRIASWHRWLQRDMMTINLSEHCYVDLRFIIGSQPLQPA